MKYIILLIAITYGVVGCIGNPDGLNTAVKSSDYQGNTPSEFKKLFKLVNMGTWQDPDIVSYFDPSGGTSNVIRYAMWSTKTVPAKGVVVHFNGRTEFIEKNMYAYTALLERGYDVWAMDWRGQGLSARIDTSIEKQKHHILDFQTYVDDAHYFITNQVNLTSYSGKKILLAHSMGGQIALRYLIQHKDDFQYAALSSPLLKLMGDNSFLRVGNLAKYKAAPTSCVITRGPDWKSDFAEQDECSLAKSDKAKISDLKPDEDDESKPAPALGYSNDVNKLADINCMIAHSATSQPWPDLRLACPTSSWLHAAFQSTDIVMKQGKSIDIPILIVRANADPAVDPEGQDEFCGKIAKNCSLVPLGKVAGIQVGHEILVESPPIFERFFREFDEFIEQSI